MEIRRAGVSDLESCFDVQKRADLAAFPHIFPPEQFPFPDADVRQRWRVHLSDQDHWCIVAEDDGGSVIGAAALRGDVFDSFAVIPELWGKGVGAALHDAVVTQARRCGFERLNLQVLELNTRARQFYEDRGWKLAGLAERLQFPPYPTLVRYAKELD